LWVEAVLPVIVQDFNVIMFVGYCIKIMERMKTPGLGQKRNAGLTYSILAAISFKIISLGTYTVIP
jgi:hypothetical protein